jgi:hypothetical protein
MRSKLKGLTEGMSVIVILIIATLILICLFPLIICYEIGSYYKNLTFSKEYNEYLSEIDEIIFFCYNDRADSKVFIEKHILPILASDVKVIFLNGRQVESNYQKPFVSRIIYSIKDKKGFPYLIRVSKGQIFDCSLNNDLFNIMNQNKSVHTLIEKVNSFRP